MITRRVKCQNCSFEQFVQEDAKECICGKCGFKIQISNDNSYTIEKHTIGELNSEKQKKRNKYRNLSRPLFVIGIVLTIYMFIFGKNSNIITMLIIDSLIAICFLCALFLFIFSGKDSTESLIEKAANKNPNMTIDSFENEYSQELYEIEQEKERRKQEARIRHQEEMEYQNKVNKLENEYHHYRSMARTFDKDTSKADWDNEQADIALAKIASLKKK